MPDVVIEGSLTPAVGVLARGERRTVALTDHVQDLIDRGYVVVVETIKTTPAKKAPVKKVKSEDG